MSMSRLAPWLIGALLATCLALWVTADASPGASAASALASSETVTFDRLAAVAAAHGHTIPDGLATYAHSGDRTFAHAPLDGIAGYTDADFQAGVLIMAVLIDEPAPRSVPNGVYVVQVKFEPGSETGIATYFDAQGRAAGSVPAHTRTSDPIHAAMPAAHDAPPSKLPEVTSTHAWHRDHDAVSCAGWQPYRVISY